MANTKEIIKELQTELDKTTLEVMTERRKRPDLTDQEWFDGLPKIELPSMAKVRKTRFIPNIKDINGKT